MFLQNWLAISILVLSMTSEIHGAECNCQCIGFRGQHICESIEKLWRVANTNTEKLLEWEKYKPFVERFSERWRKEISDIVEMKIDEYIAEGKFYPKPENLISRPEALIQSDSSMISKQSEDDSSIFSNLLVKVEMVENRTMEVEEELKSERRVRRDLEKEVKETRSSLIFLGDQLQNVTAPVDTMIDKVQTVIFSSLEDMNKTIYEEHLKKLYYKVDGVAYKNETKKLVERLENVEIELHGGDNTSIVSKLAEDIKSLEENVYLLNTSIEDTLVPRIETLNNSIGDVLIPRIQTLETETVRMNATEELQERMASLLNNTELFKIALLEVWSDIKDIRNIEDKFHNFTEQWSISLQKLQSQVEMLKNESFANKEAPNNNEIFQKILEDPFQSNDSTLNDDYRTWDPEVTPNVVHRLKISENDTAEYEEGKTWEPLIIVDRLNILENNTDYEKYSTWAPEDTPKVVNRSKYDLNTTSQDEEIEVSLGDVDKERIDREISEASENCKIPYIKDPNLLVYTVTDSNGKIHLKFRCRSIGLYAVSNLPVPPRCGNGTWKEPFPSCIKLPNVATIENLAKSLQEKYINKCSGDSVELPVPSNCSQFFKCAHGKISVMNCPPGLHFNARLKVCDYPRKAACTPVRSVEDEELRALIPPIIVEPDNIDKPSSFLGTSDTGQLIVHPRSSFTLHCLYPENIWGYPKWNITYMHKKMNDQNNIVSNEGNHRVSLTVTVATEEDSGIYRCITPNGVQHTLEIVVKAIVCPAFMIEEEDEDVFYRPTPEGELRIMGTRAEFQCEEGHRVYSQCMANGKWSKELPLSGECTLKKRSSNSTWNCRPLDASKHTDLILERNDIEKIVTFKCAGGKRLIGNSFTRCRDDGLWSHTSLPKCKN